MYQEEFAEILSYHFMVFIMMKIRKNIKKNKKLEFLIDILKKRNQRGIYENLVQEMRLEFLIPCTYIFL